MIEPCKCGKPVHSWLWHNIGGVENFWCECPDCGLLGEIGRDEEEAVYFWNSMINGVIREHYIDFWDIGF